MEKLIIKATPVIHPSLDWIANKVWKRSYKDCSTDQRKLVDLAKVNAQGNIDLRRANLRGFELQWVDLEGADLEGVLAYWANLQHSNFRGANLVEAKLGSTDLRGADFRGANLGGAKLGEADLRGANLRGVCLRGVFLRQVILRGTDLRGLKLRGANLRETDLRKTDLRGICFREVDLSDAKLSKDNFRDANLDGAIIADGYVLTTRKPYQINGVGSEEGTLELYHCHQGWYVMRGCFSGSLPEFLAAVEETHGDNEHGKRYRAIVAALCD